MTSEREYAYRLTSAEIELIEIVRLAHLSRFSMSIEHRDASYAVRLTDLATGKANAGSGSTLEPLGGRFLGATWPV